MSMKPKHLYIGGDKYISREQIPSTKKFKKNNLRGVMRNGTRTKNN